MDNEEKIMLILSQMSQKLDFVHTTVIKIENEHGAKLQALIDGQVAAEEKLANHEPRITKLEGKAIKHDVEIAHLLRKAK